MGVAVGMLLPVCIWALAYLLARRELRQYRAADEIGTDLFVYTRGRLYRRMTGVAMLVALGGTLAAFELLPPRTPAGASAYMAVLVSEVLALLVLPMVDLWETARSARPEDLTRQGRTPPRTRTPPRPPRSAAS